MTTSTATLLDQGEGCLPKLPRSVGPMPPDIPTISTARLTLRPQVVDDFPAYLAFLASPRSVGMGGPFDVRAAWRMFCHDLACWRLFGHGALMIELTALALRAWAFATLRLSSRVSYMSPDNAMSAAVASDWAACSIRQRRGTIRMISSTAIGRRVEMREARPELPPGIGRVGADSTRENRYPASGQ
ncbi:hypothetical protein ACVIGA_004705 [Bradyrhizobium sp. USDA 3240]